MRCSEWFFCFTGSVDFTRTKFAAIWYPPGWWRNEATIVNSARTYEYSYQLGSLLSTALSLICRNAEAFWAGKSELLFRTLIKKLYICIVLYRSIYFSLKSETTMNEGGLNY